MSIKQKITFAITLLSILLLLIFSTGFYLKQKHYVFTNYNIKDIKINTYSIVPSFDKNIRYYDAITLNNKANTQIEIINTDGKSIIKNIKIKKLKRNEYIRIVSFKNKKKYKTRLIPESLPEYELKTEEGHSKGYIFAVPIDVKNWSYSAAMIIKTNGDLIFYHLNPSKDFKLMANLQKITLPNKKVYYAINMGVRKGTTSQYYDCEIWLFDTNFNLVRKICFPDGSLSESHIFKMLDEEHYFLNKYYTEKMYIPSWKKEVFAQHNLVQEIKDGKVVFEFDTKEHIKLLSELNTINTPSHKYYTLAHLNDIIIDPKDNNLIISLGYASCLIKMERKTGKIIWILGSKKDMFNIKEEQNFYLQHTPILTKDGYLTLLNDDNSFFAKRKTHANSSILKFKLDEKNLKIADFKKIELDYYIDFMGSIQNLKDNRYFISYGVLEENIFAKEKDIEKNIDYLTLKIPNYKNYKTLFYETLK